MNAFNPGVAVVAGVGPGLGASLVRNWAKKTWALTGGALS
jgi:hypothetical protein